MYLRFKKELMLLLLLIETAVLLTICNAEARSETLIIKPKEENTFFSPELTSSEYISGNISILNGIVDFSIIGPSGKNIFNCDHTNSIKFNFTAIEEGSYRFRFISINATNNSTGTLHYKVDFRRDLSADINIGTNIGHIVGVARVVRDLPNYDEYEDLYIKSLIEYLNYKGSYCILNTAREAWKYLPLLTDFIIVGKIFSIFLLINIITYLPWKPLEYLNNLRKLQYDFCLIYRLSPLSNLSSDL